GKAKYLPCSACAGWRPTATTATATSMIGTILPSSNRLVQRKLFGRLVSAGSPSLDGSIIAFLGLDPSLAVRPLDLFPERRMCFQVVHEKFGCCKRSFAVGRRGYYKHYFFPGRDPPVTVNNSDARQPPTVSGFGHVTLDLGLRHAGIMLERERCYRFAVLDAPANSGKCDEGPYIVATARKLRHFRGGVERFALQSHSRFHALNLARQPRRGYPPVMGGKNAISRASLIAASDRTWRWSIAARITCGFSKACAYSSPRDTSHAIRSPTVFMPDGNSITSSGLPIRSRTQAK